jgi:4-hydroxybenzoate polyprenyltransferase
MALNRLIDMGVDAANPRTASRELPAGLLTVGSVGAFCIGSLAVFLLAVWQLDPIVRWLWPIPVAMFVIYPYLKRFTWLCHVWLGVVDGLAPVGGWVAVTGELPWEAWVLGVAVATWVAGFDLFYSLFDVEIDREQGLHSWAVRFGERGVFVGARVMHVLTVLCLAAVGFGLEVSAWYWLGVLATAVLLAYEHMLVRPGDLRRLDAAFFTMNGVISVVFCAFVLFDVSGRSIRYSQRAGAEAVGVRRDIRVRQPRADEMRVGIRFSTSSRRAAASAPIATRTRLATPFSSRTSPSRMCSVSMKLWPCASASRNDSSSTFFARGVNGSCPVTGWSDSRSASTMRVTSLRTFSISAPCRVSTCAAMPASCRSSPSRRCSVPTHVCRSPSASSWASTTTWRAPSVNRSNMPSTVGRRPPGSKGPEGKLGTNRHTLGAEL